MARQEAYHLRAGRSGAGRGAQDRKQPGIQGEAGGGHQNHQHFRHVRVAIAGAGGNGERWRMAVAERVLTCRAVQMDGVQ